MTTKPPSSDRPGDSRPIRTYWLTAGAAAIIVALIAALVALRPWSSSSSTPLTTPPVSPSLTQTAQAASTKLASQTPKPTIAPTSGGASTSVTATILRPAPGAMVPLCPSVSGVASQLPNNMALWLFIQIPDQNNRPARWYVIAKLRPDSVGKWSVPLFQVGDPGPGRPYWLEIFASNISAAGSITSADLGNVAYSSIPPGFDSHPITTVPVYREDTPANQTCP